MKTILIVDDEPGIVLALSDELAMEGFRVLSAQDGEEGIAALAKRPDLVILDVMMPKLTGLELVKRLRRQGDRVPVLILTAKGEEVDKLLGLELGADDYVTKPFSLREVVARVKTILRRVEEAATRGPVEKLEFGDVALDFRRFEARKNGKALELTPREFRILKFFAERPGEVIRRDEFLNKVWGEDVYITDRSVDNQIFNIRQKVEEDPASPRFILSIRSVGYKFVPEGGRP
ncbi:MAG TPA: response regulator transcription factor [Thermoanaerobaculia bacterium]|nr:response regulator transcription factor [Thermoanaerobaculia bacterium]